MDGINERKEEKKRGMMTTREVLLHAESAEAGKLCGESVTAPPWRRVAAYSVEYNSIQKKKKKKKVFFSTSLFGSFLVFLFLRFFFIIVKREVGGTLARPSTPPPSITPRPTNESPPGPFAASLRLKGGPKDIAVEARSGRTVYTYTQRERREPIACSNKTESFHLSHVNIRVNMSQTKLS